MRDNRGSFGHQVLYEMGKCKRVSATTSCTGGKIKDISTTMPYRLEKGTSALVTKPRNAGEKRDMQEGRTDGREKTGACRNHSLRTGKRQRPTKRTPSVGGRTRGFEEGRLIFAKRGKELRRGLPI